MTKHIILTFFLFTACTNFCSAQKKEAFDYPEYLPTDDSSRAAFKKQFYQGQVIYKITCAKCHNKMIDGKEVIPDFSLPQLMDYEIRIYPEHSEKLPDTKLSDQELANIISFLRFRKKAMPKN